MDKDNENILNIQIIPNKNYHCGALISLDEAGQYAVPVSDGKIMQ